MKTNNLHKVVVATCDACNYRNFRSFAPNETFNLEAVTEEEEKAHDVFSRKNSLNITSLTPPDLKKGTSCPGQLDYRTVDCSPDLTSVLYRSHVNYERLKQLRETTSVAARASLLGIPVDLATALLFAERELDAKKTRTASPHEMVIGLGVTKVDGQSSANIIVQPQCQCLFRPERLEIPPEVAPDFLLTDIKVGKNSQLCSVGAIPMSVFLTHRHEYLKVKMDVAQPSMFVTVSVTNLNAYSRHFIGAIIGHQLESFGCK
jgi:hypothetical protein